MGQSFSGGRVENNDVNSGLDSVIPESQEDEMNPRRTGKVVT